MTNLKYHVTRWTQQRERIERLHLQAYHNIIQNSDEFVKDFIISYNKVKKHIIFIRNFMKIFSASIKIIIVVSIN